MLLRDCWRQGALFLWSRNGVRVRCPVPGPSRHAPVAARGWFSFWPVGVPCFLGVRAVDGGFCGGHGPGVTPGPFPNPEAKAWHGDGTAPGRVWESNTPPQTFVQVGFPVEPTLRETPFFILFLTGSPWTGWPPREDSFLRSPAVGHRGLLRLLSQRGRCAFPRPRQEFHVGASTNPMSGYRLSADGRPRSIIVQLSQA